MIVEYYLCLAPCYVRPYSDGVKSAKAPDVTVRRRAGRVSGNGSAQGIPIRSSDSDCPDIVCLSEFKLLSRGGITV